MADPNNSSGNVWGWLSAAQTQALQFAAKAQESIEVASKIAQDHAAVVAQEAVELAKKYELEKASSIFMGTVGTTEGLKSAGMTEEEAIRFKEKLNNLDVVYITENILNMGFPYDPRKNPKQAVLGNDISAVAYFLKKKHGGHYMIWNISEEGYNYSLFGDQVLEYKFPGHPAPPLGLLFKICTSVESWLDADENNIAVVHCLTGKGRTAALTACMLTWIGEFDSPVEALQYIADRRGMSVDHLTIPSQRRYVQYFSNMLDGVKPRSEPLLLRRVIMNSIPVFGTSSAEDPDSQGCCPYIQLFKNGKLIATAAPHDDALTNVSRNQLQLRWALTIEGSVSFTLDCAVQGDILLRCRHAAASGARISMFRAGFHTGYVPSGVLRLTKAQLDGASSDTRFDEDFFIDLIFAPITKANPGSSEALNLNTNSAVIDQTDSAAPTLNVPVNDNGLVIDATSSDKYEMSLHKDGRFWESISSRKQKSKKRRARKFISSQQEQFSISDDMKFLEDEDSSEVSFTRIPQSNSKASNVSGMSDMELIMQLAMAEGDKEVSSNKSNTVSVASDLYDLGEPGLQNNSELQALEDLEKELGLGDLNLFGDKNVISSPNLKASEGSDPDSLISDYVAPKVSGKTTERLNDDDNLDELEQYLNSISKK